MVTVACRIWQCQGTYLVVLSGFCMQQRLPGLVAQLDAPRRQAGLVEQATATFVNGSTASQDK